MLFSRTKYINSPNDAINYKISEYLIGDIQTNGNNNNTANCSTPDGGNDSLNQHDLQLQTSNDCDSRFLRLPEGIDLALHRAKVCSKYAKDLINYIEKKTNLEAEHAQSLTKLAQTMKPILSEEKYLPFQSVYGSLLDQDIENSGNYLANSSLVLGHKFIEPLAARRIHHEKTRKQIKQEWQRELKRTHEGLNNLRKARMIYFQRKQEYDRLKNISAHLGDASSAEFSAVECGPPSNKIERKKRVEEEACQRVQEAEIMYRNAINEANERTKACEEVKKSLLARIRELMFQCDQTLKAVTVGYLQLQHTVSSSIPVGYKNLCETAKLYQPGSEYLEYVKGFPTELNGIATKGLNESESNGSPSNNKLEAKPNGRRTISESGESCEESFAIASRSNALRLVKSSSSDEVDGCVEINRENGCYQSSGKHSTLPQTSQSHHLRKVKTPSRCRNCDTYVCFQGLECTKCGLICHRKCLQSLNINCGRRSRLPRKMTTFGVDLKSQEEEIPYIVIKCINELEKRGKGVKGLYRVSGVKSRVEKLCQSFESEGDLVDISDIHPNVIANVLKLYLRQLPEPLITFKAYPEFIRVAKQYPSSTSNDQTDGDDPRLADQIIVSLKEAASKLPMAHFQTLSYLCHHLKRIADNHKMNNMPSSNLGIVFGPTLLRTSEGTASLSSLIDTGHQTRVVQLLITYADQIFGPPAKFDDGNQAETRSHSGDQSKVKTSRTELIMDITEANGKCSPDYDANGNNNNRDDFSREKLSPTPSIYSSSAVIKLSGQQIITSSSFNPSQSYADGSMSSRNSLYELRRQFFASSPSQLRSLPSIPTSSTSTASQHNSATTVATATPTTLTKSSLTLSHPRKIKKASIVSSNTSLSGLPISLSQASSQSIKGSGN